MASVSDILSPWLCHGCSETQKPHRCCTAAHNSAGRTEGLGSFCTSSATTITYRHQHGDGTDSAEVDVSRLTTAPFWPHRCLHTQFEVFYWENCRNYVLHKIFFLFFYFFPYESSPTRCILLVHCRLHSNKDASGGEGGNVPAHTLLFISHPEKATKCELRNWWEYWQWVLKSGLQAWDACPCFLLQPPDRFFQSPVVCLFLLSFFTSEKKF